MHSWVKGIQVFVFFLNKGLGSLQRGDSHKNAKTRVESFKNVLVNHWTRKAQIYMKTSWHNAN
jgi:hypothetical protein